MQNTTPHSIAVFQPWDSALYQAFPSFSYSEHQCTVEAAKAMSRSTEKYRNCHSSRDSAENKRGNYRKVVGFFEEFTLVGLSSLYFLFEIKVSFNWDIIYFIHMACKNYTQTQLLEKLHLYSQQVHLLSANFAQLHCKQSNTGICCQQKKGRPPGTSCL